MCLYVLSSVLLISLVFFVLSCNVALCSEFVLLIFLVFRVVLLQKYMCLYVLSSVLLISLVFCVVLFQKCMCLYVLSSVFADPGFFYGVHVAHFSSFFVLFCYVSLCSEFRVVVSDTISAYKGCSVRLYLQLWVVWFMSYLRYLREGVCGFYCLPLLVFCPFSFHHCLSSTKHSF